MRHPGGQCKPDCRPVIVGYASGVLCLTDRPRTISEGRYRAEATVIRFLRAVTGEPLIIGIQLQVSEMLKKGEEAESLGERCADETTVPCRNRCTNSNFRVSHGPSANLIEMKVGKRFSAE